MHWKLLTDNIGKKGIANFIRHSEETTKQSHVEDNSLQKDSLISVPGFISQLHGWRCRRSNIFLPLHLASEQEFHYIREKSIYKNITFRCDFSFIFCTRRRNTKEGDFCNMSCFFANGNDNIICPWGTAKFFIMCINLSILIISQTTEFEYKY